MMFAALDLLINIAIINLAVRRRHYAGRGLQLGQFKVIRGGIKAVADKGP